MQTRSRTGKTLWPARPGTAAVEFALILPILMLLLLGCIDFGRFPHSYIAVTNAARAGAGFGSVNPYSTATATTWKADIKQAVVDEISKLDGFDKTQLNVTSTYIDEGNGLWRVKVTVSYPFQTVVNWPGLPNNVTMQQTAVLRGIR
jgi:Flp pilus assembly protein TadG